MVPPHLYELPRILKDYDVREPITPPPPDKNECIVCLRAFGRVDDVDDPNELPCRALQLPCGHYIGSECLLKMRESQLHKRCALCRREIPLGKAIPWYLEALATAWLFRAQLRYARYLAERNGDDREFHRLTRSLLSGTMDAPQAFNLMSIYMQVPIRITRNVCLVFAASNPVFYIIGKLFGKKYIEVWVACRLLGHQAIAATKIHAMTLDLGLFMTALTFFNELEDYSAVELRLDVLTLVFGARFASLLLGWPGIVLLMGLNMTSYGLLVVALLACGMMRRSRSSCF